MGNILIDGEIYIKTKPHYIYPDNGKLKKIEQELYDIKFIEADKGITKETLQKKELLLHLKKTLSTIIEDKRYMKEFHIIDFSENNITMNSYNILGQKQELKYNSIDDIKEEYIKLSTFLRDAEYIGKEFIRTKPLIVDRIKDISYITEDPYTSTTVLYKTDYAMLVEYKSTSTSNLEMLEPIYFKDNNYKLIGTTCTEPTKKETYIEILEEISKRTKQYKRYYKNKH